MKEFDVDKPPRYKYGVFKVSDTYLNAINVEDYYLIKNK